MNDNGYIKLHRSILGWEWIDDLNTLRLWIHLLCTVTWEKSKYKGMELQPGQRIASLTQLDKEIKALSIRKIRTAKQRLIDTGEVTVSDTPFGDLITIVNWAKYQVRETRTDTANDTDVDTETTRDVTRERHEKEEDKEDKNIINSARTPAHAHTRDANKEETLDGYEIAPGLWVPNRPPVTDEEKRANYYKVMEVFRASREEVK